MWQSALGEGPISEVVLSTGLTTLCMELPWLSNSLKLKTHGAYCLWASSIQAKVSKKKERGERLDKPPTLSTMPPPTLQQLAMQNLLEDEALAVSALEDLPVALFPTLFIDVVVKRRMAVLKAMVQAWPFPRLPLGALLGREDLEMLKVILEGLDMLLKQQVRPRCKLQVLDLWNQSLNIWTSGYIAMSRACSVVDLTEEPAANHHPEMTEEPPFRIFIDVVISDDPQYCVIAHLVRWTEERKGRVQLCSKKVQILSHLTFDAISQIKSILPVLHLESIQELLMDGLWDPKTMEKMFPYLIRMKNLRILSLSKMNMEHCTSGFNLYKHFLQLVHHDYPQFYMKEALLFHYEKLAKVFRNLKPLTTLSLSSCPLKESDLRCLSLCPSTSQLKHLRLRSVYLGDYRPGLLRALLGRVAGTLEALALEHCGITDAQLSALLPTLSQCSRLSLFSFYGNPISMVALQNLLSHTARLSKLSGGLYPAPMESYHHQCLYWCEVNKERFAQVCVGLQQILRDIQPAHNVQICTHSCMGCKKCQFYSLVPSGNWVFTEEYPAPGIHYVCSLVKAMEGVEDHVIGESKA
ncbi:PRAME family member 8-like [Perognathus longimembris pacificus]|uniref:PRAME family member 8-like n=1 Tax=Perognathus longimembris pacificus TaxID=214514 RepID=UPI00201925A5|nr:PRAME family member 8-like [Perognathus longimembris pacificus]